MVRPYRWTITRRGHPDRSQKAATLQVDDNPEEEQVDDNPEGGAGGRKPGGGVGRIPGGGGRKKDNQTTR